MAGARWQPRLSAQAESDLRAIMHWTVQRFGPAQAGAYRDIVLSAVRDLQSGPDQPGVRRRDDLAAGVMTVHVARHGRPGRHFVVFKLDPDKEHAIEVLRILHDAMDLARHLRDAKESG